MNLLFVNYEHPPLGGGGGVAAGNLARELVRRGHAVDYVTTHYRGLARREVLDGVTLYREPVAGRQDLQTAGILSMLAFPAVAVLRGVSLARRTSYDLVHTHFAIPSGPAGAVLSRLLRLPHILSVYGGDIYDPSKSYSPHRHPVLKRVVRGVLNQADRIVPESTDLSARVGTVYAPRTPVRTIPLGFAPPPAGLRRTRGDLGLREDGLYAVAISRLVPRKAYGDLLRAFERAGVEGLELLIVGDGPEEPVLRRLAQELGIADRVRFAGWQSESGKYDYLGAADFFVLSPLHEGFGIVYQEAMHAGLAIATTNAGGQTDFLQAERNALLTPPNDVPALAASIRRLATEPETRAAMGRQNREDLAAHGVDRVAAAYLELYEEVLAARKGRGR